MLYQQGDVLMKSLNKLPAEAKHIKRASKGYILAEGEVTGHSHAVLDEIEMFEKNGLRFIRADNEFTVTHQEHQPIVVPPGVYQLDIVQEYDHFAEEARRVID